MSFNKIFLYGNLGRDPEMRYTASGTPICSFSLATSERRKDASGQATEITTWFQVKAWNKLAETANQYLQTGRPVWVEGRVRLDEYTDRDGKPRVNIEVTATEIKFMSGGNRTNEQKDTGTGGQPKPEEDVPF
jgi:single-strand DNA-binding protein